MHTSLYLFLVLLFFLGSQLFLSSQKLSFLVISLLAEAIRKSAGEPASHSALNIQSCGFSLFSPHLAGKVRPWIDDFILAPVDIEITLFHLSSELAHHDCGLGLVLVSLHHALVTLRVIRGRLICLRERVMVSLTGFIVSEAANIWLHAALLFDLNGNDLNLVVSQANFYFEHLRHDEFICFNRIEVVLLLLLAVSLHYLAWDVHLIILLP